MIRKLFISYRIGIRSESRSCDEVRLNLPYCWFRDSDLLRKQFETTAARCMAEGLVGGEPAQRLQPATVVASIDEFVEVRDH